MFSLIDGFLPLWVRVFIQLVDYLLKAADQWRSTPEGAKEWADFTTLYEQALNDGTQANVTFGVEDRVQQNPSQPENAAPKSRAGRVVIGGQD